MSIRKSVVALLPGGEEGVEEPSDEVEEETEAEMADSDGADVAGLYNCSSCRTTYISEAMDMCPDCETTVESVPTEADLGMV